MCRCIVAVLLATCAVLHTNAQQASMSSVSQAPTLVLRDGEPVVLRALQRATSADAAVGQQVQLEVIKPVKLDDLVIVAEGAVAVAKVTAVEHKRRMGRGGTLALAIERVQLVNGQYAPLRAVIAKTAGGKGAMASDMTGALVASYGLALPFTPLFLLKHGNDMAISPGDRFVSYVDGDLSLERGSIAVAQDTLKTKKDVAVVYVFRAAKDPGAVSQASVLCGDILVGSFHEDQFVRMELPAGVYWFRSGKPAYKKFEKLRRADFLPLTVQAGSAYYLQVYSAKTSFWSDSLPHLKLLSEQVGADAVAQINYRAESALEVGPQNLDKLQKQVPADAPPKPAGTAH